jgi:hypothetical protein
MERRHMASGRDGSNVANRGKPPVTADYGQRAAMALERCIPGPNRDKAIARLFGVSDRMARYLRCGQHWTAERLTQASKAITDFDEYISAPNIRAKIDRLEADLAEVKRLIREGEDV